LREEGIFIFIRSIPMIFKPLVNFYQRLHSIRRDTSNHAFDVIGHHKIAITINGDNAAA
jgi:hypothetical protein